MDTSSRPPAGNIRPLHLIPTQPGERVVRKPGRPKRVRLPPSASEVEYQKAVRTAREEALASDPLLTATSSENTVQRVIEQLAREAASLGFDRERAQDRGLDSAAQLSSRRVDALWKIVNLVVDANKMGVWGNDASPKKVQKILAHLVESIARVAHETLPRDDAKLLLERYEAVLATLDLSALLADEPVKQPT